MSILVRVRSDKGTQRVALSPHEDLNTLIALACQTFGIADPGSTYVSADPAGKSIIHGALGQPLQQLGIKHGDMVYLHQVKDTSAAVKTPQPMFAPKQPQKEPAPFADAPPMDELDRKLMADPGMIERKRDPHFCKHAENGMCEYCIPLDPFDADYLAKHNIKHMSYHAYLRRLHGNQAVKTSFTANAVAKPTMPKYTVDLHCKTGHKPWPAGVCSKCQPSAVTLARQSFRFVDHVEFAKPAIIEQFLQPWRMSGAQHFGYLYGRYEPYANVPLGIKAVVEAIYVPFQNGHPDWVEPLHVLEGEHGVPAQVAAAAKDLGLVQVGMIWTDLVDDGQGQGKVLPKRHAASWFLSGQEAIFCAKMQSMRRRLDGFGSRFVTCIITGNEQGEVDIAAYQVSNEAEAMVEADLVVASVNPNLLRVQKETPTRYVPEVFYTFINEYGLKERKAARPTFPVEYWLVNVSHGFPSSPSPTFLAPEGVMVEAGPAGASIDAVDTERNVARIKQYMRSIGFLNQDAWTRDNALALLSDFGVYVCLVRTGLLSPDECQLLAQAITTHQPALWTQFVHSPGWQTLFAVLDAAASKAPDKVTTTQPQTWSCPHCTFENVGDSDTCEMCGLPRE